MIVDLKQGIDIAPIVENAGVSLKRSGCRRVGLCPFHDEKTPSFYVFDDNRFKCFGCGEHGDVIDFVQKLYSLSFADALKHLGIEQGHITPEMKAKIECRKAERQKTEAKKRFKTNLQNTLLILISATKKAANNFKSIDDFERYGDLLQPLSWWEHCLDVLSFGIKDEQEKVCEQFKDIEVIPVKPFFKKKFNLNKVIDKIFEKRNADEWTINLYVAGCETSCAEAPSSG